MAQFWQYEPREVKREREAARFKKITQVDLGKKPAPPWTDPDPSTGDQAPPVGPKAAGLFDDYAASSLDAWASDVLSMPPPSSVGTTPPTIGATQPTGATTTSLPVSSYPTANAGQGVGARILASPPVQAGLGALAGYQRNVVEPMAGAVTMTADELGRLGRGEYNTEQGAALTRARREQPRLSLEEIAAGWERLGEHERQWQEPAPGVKFLIEATTDLSNIVPLGAPAKASAKVLGKAGRALGEEAAIRALEVGRPAFAAEPLGSVATHAVTAAPEKAGNILLEKFPEELRPTIQRAWESAPARMEAARRGVVSDEQVQELAAQVGITPRQFTARWKPGQASNAETILAMREALAAKTKSVLDAQQAIQQGGDSSENLARLTLAVQEHAALQEAIAGATAEAGRALRQYRQLVPADTSQAALAKVLEKMGGRERAAQMARKLGELDTDNPVAVADFLRNATRPQASDYLLEIWYNSLLSSPKTHAINVLSNTLATALAPVERALSAGLEAGLSRVQRRPAERFMGEAPAEAIGAIRGLQEGGRKGLFILRHGYTMGDAAKLELRRGEAIRGPLGALINTPSRALSAADALFRSVNYSGSLHTEAYRLASKEGKTGAARAERMAELLATPTPELMEAAGKMSAYRVYQQEMGSFTKAIAKARDANLYGLPVMRFIVPFLATPVNVTKFGLERSPAGFLNPKLAGALRKGSPEAADMLGRAVAGSLVAGAIAAYAWDGRITGRAPTKASEKDAFHRQGKQPFSIKVGDQWISYQRLEPLNQPIAQIAALADASKRRGDEPPLSLVMDVALTIGRNLVSQNYLTGIADVLDALEDPERYGGRFAERMGASLAVPWSAGSRFVAQAIDPVRREPRGLEEAIKANLPGLSQEVPAQLDAMGQEKRRETPWYSPIEVSTEKADPVEEELERLGVQVGEVGATMGKVKLSREQQRRYQTDAGALAQAGLKELLASDYYRSAGEEDKRKALASTITRMHTMARDNLADTLAGGSRIGQQPRPLATLRSQASRYVKAWAEYQALPKYRGMDAEQSAQADAALRKIRALAREKKLSEAAATRRYEEIDAEGAQLAATARRVGTNPERKWFLKEHPELAGVLEEEEE